MFAPAHHSAMRHAIGPRKELAMRTIFNVLGPLTNPAGAPNQVLGVFDETLLTPPSRSFTSTRVSPCISGPIRGWAR